MNAKTNVEYSSFLLIVIVFKSICGKLFCDSPVQNIIANKVFCLLTPEYIFFWNIFYYLQLIINAVYLLNL